MKTIEGVILTKGLKVWEVGITSKGIYTPTLSVFNGGVNDVTNIDRCWLGYSLCRLECDRLQEKEQTEFYKLLAKGA